MPKNAKKQKNNRFGDRLGIPPEVLHAMDNWRDDKAFEYFFLRCDLHSGLWQFKQLPGELLFDAIFCVLTNEDIRRYRQFPTLLIDEEEEPEQPKKVSHSVSD